MKSDAQKFIDCLDDAVRLLDDNPTIHFPATNLQLEHAPTEQFDLALFEQWSDACEPAEQKQSPIRIIHHLSCTGGTLIGKFLAAMPNVSLLSEVNPLSTMDDEHRAGFAPTDMIYLTRQARFPLANELSQKLFKADIQVILEHIRNLGRYLILREHSHSFYHVDPTPNEVDSIREFLNENHSLLSIVTVRHPIDSYLSLLNNDWLRFSPATFDEYCRRYLLFLESHKNEPVFKYEMLIDNVQEQMKLICEVLSLPFSEDFLDLFDLFQLSGDSGRASSTIGRRSRRKYNSEFVQEANQSSMYSRLCEELDYDPVLTDPEVREQL